MKSTTDLDCPVLLVGVGRGAIQTLAELARRAQKVSGTLVGSFAALLIDYSRRQLFISSCRRLSDLEVPRLSGSSHKDRWVDYAGDETVLNSVSSVMRNLRLSHGETTLQPPHRVRICSYLVMDISDNAVILPTVELVRSLRKVDPSLDITGLALTGRTAESEGHPGPLWFDAWNQLLGHLQNEPLLQRLYLIDGCDARNTWLRTSREMQRLGAEFVLHHGFSPCRSYMRNKEKSCMTVTESFLNFCGSFAYRRLHVDRQAITRRVAFRLADDLLVDLREGELDGEWKATVDKKAEELASEIVTICAAPNQVDENTVPEVSADARGQGSPQYQVNEAVRRMVTQICVRQPVLSFRRFVRSLRDALNRMSIQGLLRERWDTRRRAAAILREQERETFEPTRQWLAIRGVKWVNRYEPVLQDAPTVLVSRPASRKLYGLGIVLLALGLVGIAAALAWQMRSFAMSVGFLVLFASTVMLVPTGWIPHVRTPVPADDQASLSLPLTAYRRQGPKWGCLAAMLLSILGLISVVLSLWLPVWLTVTTVEPLAWGAISAVLAGIGLAFLRAGTKACGSATTEQEEMPGLVGPVRWARYGLGLVFLATAWIFLCLQPLTLAHAQRAQQWYGLLTGSAMLMAGVALARWPWVGRAQLSYQLPPRPLPLKLPDSELVCESGLNPQIHRICHWCEGFLTDRCAEGSGCMGSDQQRDACTALDGLTRDWDERLAAEFSVTLQSQTGSSLVGLAEKPEAWADCLVAELTEQSAEWTDETRLFALHGIRTWTEKQGLQDLISCLSPDPQQVGPLITGAASPHWPMTRTKPDVDVSILAVGRELWPLAAPLAESQSPYHVVPLDWQDDPYAIVIIHMVQGLTEGWRGFPGMPGQVTRTQ
jgi:hypothetical protein